VASDLLLAIGTEPGRRSPLPGAHPGANRGPRRPRQDATVAAHAAAAGEWGVAAPHSFDYLKALPHPVLVINGSHDIVIPTVNSYILQQNLPNAELILFPDSNHGSHFQFTELFNRRVTDVVDR
jgi:pimeloyl-ACP methyl ester carboxylesterase